MKILHFVPQHLLEVKNWSKLQPFLSDIHVSAIQFDMAVVEFYIGLDPHLGPYIRIYYPCDKKEKKLYFLQVLERDFFDIFCTLLIPEVNFPNPEPYLLNIKLCFVRFTEILTMYEGYRVLFKSVVSNLDN